MFWSWEKASPVKVQDLNGSLSGRQVEAKGKRWCEWFLYNSQPASFTCSVFTPRIVSGV